MENLIRVLTGRLPPSTPRSKRLLSDDRSNILVYMTGTAYISMYYTLSKMICELTSLVKQISDFVSVIFLSSAEVL